jgi:N-dimethylarginine dimethylaminohydrolase
VKPVGPILMCRPTYFEVRYAINPWMNGASSSVSPQRAMAQWLALKAEICRSAVVTTIDPQPDLPDFCCTANAGLVCDSIFVASRFLHEQRRLEEEHFTAWFLEHGYDCRRLRDDIVFEGAGDALFDARRRLWVGYGQRSAFEAGAELSRMLDVETVSLRLVDPRFYHLDTCFSPLRNGCVVYFPAAFDRASLAAIERGFPPERRIEVTEQDAAGFACNLVDLGDAVVLNHAGAALRKALGDHGIAVRQVALDEFLKSGGSAKCLTLALRAQAHHVLGRSSKPFHASQAPSVA